ncbi:MATE family efflux transporter [Frondihabitans cladoniiphilus]|uniref:O-antigen/teichoic acid export membrane protein n=1 Tax=Frondihabitans cladoniiphilus TaxID=715785 RepID=A0ABP8VX35_9MICO
MSFVESEVPAAALVAERESFLATHQKKVLFGIKSSNLGLITLYQFLLIFVLTRTVGADIYPVVVLLSSIGNYIIGTDLGFSGFVYAHVRERFIRKGVADTDGFVNSSINLYLLIPAAALLVAAFVIPLTLQFSTVLLAGLVIYFASIIFSLPWQMVRSIMMAIDGFMLMETLEFFRRLVLVLLVFAMLVGLPFVGFAIACVAVWVVAFTAAFIALRRRGIDLHPVALPVVGRFARDNRGKVARTASFAGMEFVLYNFPYLLIPALALGGHTLVFYDLFYKVTRFAGVAFNVPIETLLPGMTRAWHEGDKGQVKKIRRQMMLLCLPIFLFAAVLLLFFGKPFFHLLLHDFPIAGSGLVWGMVAMMGLILVQATTGGFLVGVGQYSTLVRVGFAALALAVIIALAGFLLHLGPGTLLVMYLVGYAAYAWLYRNAFSRLLRRTA